MFLIETCVRSWNTSSHSRFFVRMSLWGKANRRHDIQQLLRSRWSDVVCAESGDQVSVTSYQCTNNYFRFASIVRCETSTNLELSNIIDKICLISKHVYKLSLHKCSKKICFPHTSSVSKWFTLIWCGRDKNINCSFQESTIRKFFKTIVLNKSNTLVYSKNIGN